MKSNVHKYFTQLNRKMGLEPVVQFNLSCQTQQACPSPCLAYPGTFRFIGAKNKLKEKTQTQTSAS